MNAHTALRPATGHTEQLNAWYRKSGITDCTTCEGAGGHWEKPFGHGNDPDNWFNECPDCDATGNEACAVCGNTVHVKGFDCLACDMVLELPSDLLNDDTAAELGKAVAAAIKVAREHRGRLSKLFAEVV